MSLPTGFKKGESLKKQLMNAKIQILAASAIACLVSGCIIPDPYYSRPVHYGRPVEYDQPVYAEEIYVPDMIIVEGGVRHDRYFYQRHPEFYHRDRLRYPDRFAHMPPPRAKKHHNDRDRDRDR